MLERDVVECAGKGGGCVYGVGHLIPGEIGMQGLGESFIGEGEARVVIPKRRVDQNLRIGSEIGERLMMIELIVEDLDHDIGSREI